MDSGKTTRATGTGNFAIPGGAGDVGQRLLRLLEVYPEWKVWVVSGRNRTGDRTHPNVVAIGLDVTLPGAVCAATFLK